MLRNKEPELAENIDNSFEWFDLVFYRVIFVFGSRHLILVRVFGSRHPILVRIIFLSDGIQCRCDSKSNYVVVLN